MTEQQIDKAIYEKYIKPTENKRNGSIGIEIEMPIVNLNKQAVEEQIVFNLTKAFEKEFNFSIAGIDDNGNVNSLIDKTTGDDLSFDCSYSNLELSLGKVENLFDVKSRFEKYYTFINDFFGKFNYTLTGMGINPYYNFNHNKPVPNERYRMLYHYLHSYPEHKGRGTDVVFHNHPDFATFCSASQVQLDVQKDTLIDTINTFGRLEPYKSILFANSYQPEYPDLLCSRNMFWEHSMQGYNPHNIGMFEYELNSIDDLLEYIKTTSIYCTMRDGKYVNFTPVPIDEYLKMDSLAGEYYDGNKYVKIEIKPQPDDLKYLRTFKFEDLTFRGTIEFRSCCCQPIKESFTVAAFHLGLIYKLQELKRLLDSDDIIYSHGYTATELQRLFSKRDLPSFVDKEKISFQLKKILDISYEGLKERGNSEESFLNPLYERAESLINPAKEMVLGIENGDSIEKYILDYARI